MTTTYDPHDPSYWEEADLGAEHASQLTRDTITASVHSLRFEASPAQMAAVAAGGARLSVDHPNYAYSVELAETTVAELREDLSAG